jgi:capsular polysaccharide transport system permease protein
MASIDGDMSDRAPSREVALRRGTAAAALLRRAARLARDESLPVSSLPAILRPRGTISDGAGGWMSVAVRLSFVVVFAIPAVLSVVYFAFIASGQYETEARFAVRSGERSSLEQMTSMSSLGNMAAVTQAQDTLVVTGYVKSRGLVETIDKELDLRKMFSRGEIDFLSSLAADAPIEDLVRYWRRRVHVAVESTSGLVTVTVSAFTPEDALVIAQAITRHSEDLVNDLSRRSSGDLLKDTESELDRAEARLKETREKLQALRNSAGTLDPDASAAGLGDVLSALRLERAKTASQLQSVGAGLAENAPQLKPLRARLAALDAQIAQLEAEMTGGGTGDLAAAMTNFDQLEVDNQVAERRYAAAVSALEAARLSAERRKVYINKFVEPALPEETTAPPRFWYGAAGVVGPFMAWAILAGIGGFVRNKFL